MTSRNTSISPPLTRRSGLRATAVAAAAMACLIGAQPALAQTNVTGSAYGAVQSGGAATIVLENLATGFKRTVTADADGRFSATALPTGTYRASVVRDGKVVSTSGSFEVLVGQGTAVAFGADAQRVTVESTIKRLDMSSTESGVTFTAAQLAQIPVGRSVAAIIQLAPNTATTETTNGNYRFGASFGGGAASENSFYINGFPVTNPLTQMGSSQLPFGAIAEAQIQTGAFGVEFGRSIGGVVNIVSKSGTNEWEAGVATIFTPASLRGSRVDWYYPQTGKFPATDGKLYNLRNEGYNTSLSKSANVGGPLIKDKLFLFAAVENIDSSSGRVGGTAGTATAESTARLNGWTERDDQVRRGLVKIDFLPLDNHRLEFTGLKDRYSATVEQSGFDYTTRTRNYKVVGTRTYVNDNANNQGVGAGTSIFKYTGYLTDSLTVQALLGRSSTPHPSTLTGYDPTKPQVAVENNDAVYPGFSYPNLQTVGGNISSPDYKDTVQSKRFDLEYKLGKHSIRAGVDVVNLSSLSAGDATAGGRSLTYASTTNAAYIDNGMTKPISGFTSVLKQGTGAATRYFYGTETIYTTVSNAYSDQSAQYLEDRWQVTKDLLLVGGLRNEQYKNLDSFKQSFLDVKGQVMPRVGFSWDALGNASTKVFGNAGRYGVQLPTLIALRGANSSLYTTQVFSYTGVNADGTPQGRVDLGPAFSKNNEYGKPKDLREVSAQNLKPNMQDELTLGIERALTPQLNAGARLTYRKLVSTIDDHCDPRPFAAYAQRMGIKNAAGQPYTLDDAYNHYHCATFNPGEDNTFLFDFQENGNPQRVALSAADLGFPKAKRTYQALDLFLEHPFRDAWYGKVNLTLARNRGNTEGQTYTELGQDNVSQTVAWDHPELMFNAYGPLPNERLWQVKAYGFYQVTPEFRLGGNLMLSAGRPYSCLGVPPASYGDDFFSYIYYGSYYRFCGGQAAPRGTAGRLPTEKRLDLNLVYQPKALKGLTMAMDVFNVTNSQYVTALTERAETSSGGPSSAAYRAGGFAAERSIRLTVSYDHKF